MTNYIFLAIVLIAAFDVAIQTVSTRMTMIDGQQSLASTYSAKQQSVKRLNLCSLLVIRVRGPPGTARS